MVKTGVISDMVRAEVRNWADCRRKTGEEEVMKDEDAARERRRMRERLLSMSKSDTFFLVELRYRKLLTCPRPALVGFVRNLPDRNPACSLRYARGIRRTMLLRLYLSSAIQYHNPSCTMEIALANVQTVGNCFRFGVYHQNRL